MLAEHRVLVVGVGRDRVALARTADVSRCDEGVSSKPARVVPGHVEPLVAVDELLAVTLEPRDERHRRLGPGRRPGPGPPLLDAAVPRADVLADVTAVD